MAESKQREAAELDGTRMKAVAAARMRPADSPVLASRLGQVCSKQWVTSGRLWPRLGMIWLSSNLSSFKEA